MSGKLAPSSYKWKLNNLIGIGFSVTSLPKSPSASWHIFWFQSSSVHFKLTQILILPVYFDYKPSGVKTGSFVHHYIVEHNDFSSWWHLWIFTVRKVMPVIITIVRLLFLKWKNLNFPGKLFPKEFHSKNIF